jgi:hypothetical protein
VAREVSDGDPPDDHDDDHHHPLRTNDHNPRGGGF